MKRTLIIISILLLSSMIGFTSQVSAMEIWDVSISPTPLYVGDNAICEVTVMSDPNEVIYYKVYWGYDLTNMVVDIGSETSAPGGDAQFSSLYTCPSFPGPSSCLFIIVKIYEGGFNGDPVDTQQKSRYVENPGPPPGCPEIEQFDHPPEGWVANPINFYVRADTDLPGNIKYTIHYSGGQSDEAIAPPNTQVTFTHTYYHATTYEVQVLAEMEDEQEYSNCNSGWHDSYITIYANAPTPPPQISNLHWDDDHIYIEDDAVLHATYASGDFDVVAWDIWWGDGAHDYGTTSLGAHQYTHKFAYSGWFTVTISIEDPNLNFDEEQIDIFVTSTPPAPPEPPEITHFALTSNNPEVGHIIESRIIGTDSDSDDALQIKMDWGDGQTETKLYSQDSECPFAHEYNNQGAYTATATVTDMDGMSDSDTLTVTVTGQEPPQAPAFGKITSVVVSGTPYEEAGDTLTFSVTIKNNGQTAGTINCEISETNYNDFVDTNSIHLTPNEVHTFIFSNSFDEAGDLRILTIVEAETSNTIDDSHLTLVPFEASAPEDPDDPDDEDDDEDGDGIPDDQDGDSGGDGIPDYGGFNPQINWTWIIIAIAGALIALKLVNFRLKNGRWPFQKEKQKTGNQKHVSTKDYDLILDYGSDDFNDTGDDFPSH